MRRFVNNNNNLLTRTNKPLEVCFEDYAKSIAVTGTLIFMMFLGACDSVSLIDEKTDETEYTTVEYSQDRSSVTLYLDGVGVPKTNAQRAIAQRAMTKDLAQAAYDFIEVIFVNGSDIARMSWVLGQPAVISNVPSTNYNSISKACMFVGRDDGKVLFGVGELTSVNNVNGTNIDANTKSIRFTISPIQSGLKINSGESVTGVVADSFVYTSRSAFRKVLDDGGVGYPVYIIPSTAGNVDGTYTFSFSGTTDYTSAIKYIGSSNPPLVTKRTPRYANGAMYKEPRSSIDTKTTVTLNGYAATIDTEFVPAIPLRFTKIAGSGGLFSFNIQVPVYMLNKNPALRNNGPGPVTWYIRTGIAAELYSLDDGVSRGGCVLMYVTDAATSAAAQTDFNKIEWTWFKEF